MMALLLLSVMISDADDNDDDDDDADDDDGGRGVFEPSGHCTGLMNVEGREFRQ